MYENDFKFIEKQTNNKIKEIDEFFNDKEIKMNQN